MKILEPNDMFECNLAYTPLESRYKFGKEEFESELYSLQEPNGKPQVLNPYKKILRFVKGAYDLGLDYEKGKVGMKVFGNLDSDYLRDPCERKRRISMAFFLGMNLI